MMDKKIVKVQERCLVKMFKVAGVKVKNFAEVKAWSDAHGERWYSTKTWTKAQQNDFEKWMHDELKKTMRWNKNIRVQEIGYFLLMWGWKVEG